MTKATTKTEIALNYPVTVFGMEYKTLTMRLPLVNDHLNVSHLDDETTASYVLYANLCEVPSEVIEEMDVSDINRVAQVWQKLESVKAGYRDTPGESIALEHAVNDVDSINLRRPKGKDNLAVAGCQSKADGEIMMMSILSGWSVDDIKSMAMCDFAKVQMRFESFLS